MKVTFTKKHIANLITLVRIILAPSLFFFNDVTKGFLIIYAVCVLSDFLDGPVARITHSTGIIGSVLDTAGDVLMYSGMMKVIIGAGAVPGWAVILISASMCVHAVSALIALHRFGKFYFAHSFMSKLMGASICLIPFAYHIGITNYYLKAVCVFSVLSSVEAVLIQLMSSSPNPDILSVFSLMKNSAKAGGPEREVQAGAKKG